jgi:hypothetical protein
MSQTFDERIEEIRASLYESGKATVYASDLPAIVAAAKQLKDIVSNLRFQIHVAKTESQFVQARALLQVALDAQVRTTNAVMAMREGW